MNREEAYASYGGFLTRFKDLEDDYTRLEKLLDITNNQIEMMKTVLLFIMGNDHLSGYQIRAYLDSKYKDIEKFDIAAIELAMTAIKDPIELAVLSPVLTALRVRQLPDEI